MITRCEYEKGKFFLLFALSFISARAKKELPNQEHSHPTEASLTPLSSMKYLLSWGGCSLSRARRKRTNPSQTQHQVHVTVLITSIRMVWAGCSQAWEGFSFGFTSFARANYIFKERPHKTNLMFLNPSVNHTLTS